MRSWIVVCGLLGALAVAMGAYGAHAMALLEDPIASGRLQTAVTYHFFHTPALLGVCLLAVINGDHLTLRVSRWLFLVGMAAFSGSLYWLALVGSVAIPNLTPFGGLVLIAAWLSLAVYGLLWQNKP